MKVDRYVWTRGVGVGLKALDPMFPPFPLHPYFYSSQHQVSSTLSSHPSMNLFVNCRGSAQRLESAVHEGIAVNGY
jgi:hypothetical protein